MAHNLEPFLKCSVIRSEYSKNRQRPYRVAFKALKYSPGSKETDLEEIEEVVVYTDDSDVLGSRLCRVAVDVMHSKWAWVRVNYIPEFKSSRNFWVPREDIKWK